MHNSGPGVAVARAAVVAALPVLAQFAGAATTRAAGSGPFNPEASFELAQKNPYSEAHPDVANGRDCHYTIRVGLVSLGVSGCPRSKVPAEADHAPFRTKPLAEKWRMLASEENNCGSEFGPDAYADTVVCLLCSEGMSSARKCQTAPKEPLRWQN